MRLLALLAVVVLAFLVSPSAAFAGGPTSVIITSPTENKAAALYTTQDEYGQLLQALGDRPEADPAAPDLHGNPGMRMVTVTWLIHDIRVWRVDHVFIDQDQLWVESSQSFENLNVYERGTVHRPANQEMLTQLLDQVLSTSVTHTALTFPTPTQPAAEGLEWMSVLIGAVCGVVLAVVGRVVFGLVSRRQA